MGKLSFIGLLFAGALSAHAMSSVDPVDIRARLDTANALTLGQAKQTTAAPGGRDFAFRFDSNSVALIEITPAWNFEISDTANYHLSDGFTP